MDSERDMFSVSGPTYLTSIDWNCSHHRRAIAASLVQATYILERDRQENRQGPEALAPAWWEFFNFELIRELIDDADFSVFGAIFKLKTLQNAAEGNAPKFVIAFRGTITKKESVSRDLTLNLQLIQNALHQTSRSQIATQAVQNVVSASGSSNIWLAGHSLGSAMATVAGKNMVKSGKFLETFLFNPPFFSAPIERIKDKKVKHGLRIATSVITAGLSLVLKAKQERPILQDSFAILSSWFPCLFVNPNDHICSEYIGYFQHRKNMEEIGADIIERLATQNSIGDMFLNAFGRESESLHLFPSANLTINLSPSPDFKSAHGIHQWWQPDLHLQTREYSYK